MCFPQEPTGATAHSVTSARLLSSGEKLLDGYARQTHHQRGQPAQLTADRHNGQLSLPEIAVAHRLQQPDLQACDIPSRGHPIRGAPVRQPGFEDVSRDFARRTKSMSQYADPGRGKPGHYE